MEDYFGTTLCLSNLYDNVDERPFIYVLAKNTAYNYDIRQTRINSINTQDIFERGIDEMLESMTVSGFPDKYIGNCQRQDFLWLQYIDYILTRLWRLPAYIQILGNKASSKTMQKAMAIPLLPRGNTYRHYL